MKTFAALLLAAYIFFLSMPMIIETHTTYIIAFSAASSATTPALPGGPEPIIPSPILLCDGGEELAIDTASIRNLCLGSSNSARIERAIRSGSPLSPLVAKPTFIAQMANRFSIDPLLILQWQFESGMATAPNNGGGPNNGGNIIWAAAKDYTEWKCRPGRENSNGYVFAQCDTLEDGIGLFFNYVSMRYPANTYPNLRKYAETYNPCGAPGNESGNCGAKYISDVYAWIQKHAGPSSTPPLVPIPTTCPPQLPYIYSESDEAKAPKIGVTQLESRLFGRNYQITQGFGFSNIAGEPPYAGYPHFHQGIDFATSMGVEMSVPFDGEIVETGFHSGQGYYATLELKNGLRVKVMHMSALPKPGVVRQGDFFGLTGNTGYSTGPHAHVEIRRNGTPVPPEHWACSFPTI